MTLVLDGYNIVFTLSVAFEIKLAFCATVALRLLYVNEFKCGWLISLGVNPEVLNLAPTVLESLFPTCFSTPACVCVCFFFLFFF